MKLYQLKFYIDDMGRKHMGGWAISTKLSFYCKSKYAIGFGMKLIKKYKYI